MIMQRKKTLKIGSSDFKGFMEVDGYFVDKTLLIQELIDTHYDVLLIPRPRRFGKSMNLSMLKYYFDAGEKDSAKLFESFKIWQAGDFYTSKQGKHPVIHLSLKGGKATTFERSQIHIYSIITETYREFRWILDKNLLAEDEIIEFKDILFKRAKPDTYESALKKLSKLKKNASADRIKVELSDALKQITKNKYYKELIAHKVQNRIEMAMVFVGKEVHLDVN